MDKTPLHGPEDLLPERRTDTPASVADVDVERGGGDPADVGLRPDTDHPNPRAGDPEEGWIEDGEASTSEGPAGGLPPTAR